MARTGADIARTVGSEAIGAAQGSARSDTRERRIVDHDHWLRHTPEIAFIADADGRMLMLNEAFVRVTGLPLEAGLEDGWPSAIHAEDRPRVLQDWRQAIERGDECLSEFRLKQADGGLRWFRSRAVRRPGPPGCGLRWYGVCADVDDLKAAETALQRSEAALRISLVNQQRTERRAREVQAALTHQARLGVVGQYASALAHELNQPLTAIGNYIAAIRAALNGGTDPAELAELVRSAEQQVARAGGIVQGLREFVAKGHAERDVQELRALLDEALDVALIGVQEAGIRVKLTLPEAPLHALANKVQIQQVLVNLARNAIEAMREGALRELEVSLHAEEVDGMAMAVICVSDTGTGVSEIMAAQLFLPFVTDKRDGMGVGLSISKAIVTSHGGTIWHATREGGGAVFKFMLPLVQHGD